MKESHYIMRRKILASMILLPIASFILIIVIGYYYFTTSLEAKTVAKMTRIVEDHRQMIESFLNERKADLQFIVDSFTLDYMRRSELLEKIFVNLQKESSAFVDLGVLNEAGIHVAYHGPYELSGKIYKETEWFNEVLRKGYYTSDVFLGYRKVPHFIIAIAKKTNGETWVLRATIDTLLFSDTVENVRIGKTGEAYIIDKNGIFQTQRRSGGSLMDKDADAFKYLTPHEGIRTFIEKDVSGEKYLYATAWLEDNNWLLVVRQEKADAFEALRSATFLVVLVTIIGGITIVAMAFYITARIVRRMERMDEEKSQLSQQLIMASRLAEVGEMSAGFAHEINNPLQIIRAEQKLIETIFEDMQKRGELEESKDTQELQDSISQITVQVDRCAEITQALLKFARQKEHVPQKVDLSNLIPEVLRLFVRKAGVEGVKIKQEISEDIPSIEGNTVELQQVLINLFNNALDAIVAKHGSEGGEIYIEARAAGKNGVEISVTDDGAGITPENMEKIFTPFFTTKPVGKGTGLGLPVCFAIIDKMGGTIEARSEAGKGTTFIVHLPATA